MWNPVISREPTRTFVFILARMTCSLRVGQLAPQATTSAVPRSGARAARAATRDRRVRCPRTIGRSRGVVRVRVAAVCTVASLEPSKVSSLRRASPLGLLPPPLSRNNDCVQGSTARLNNATNDDPAICEFRASTHHRQHHEKLDSDPRVSQFQKQARPGPRRRTSARDN